MRHKLENICNEFKIPKKIKKTAWNIFSTAVSKKITKGKSKDGFIAASLYLAIKNYEFSLNLEDILKWLVIPKRTALRAIILLQREVLPELNIRLDLNLKNSYCIPIDNNSRKDNESLKNLLNKLDKFRDLSNLLNRCDSK